MPKIKTKSRQNEGCYDCKCNYQQRFKDGETQIYCVFYKKWMKEKRAKDKCEGFS